MEKKDKKASKKKIRFGRNKPKICEEQEEQQQTVPEVQEASKSPPAPSPIEETKIIVTEHEKFLQQQLYIAKQKEFQKRQLELQRRRKAFSTDQQQTKTPKTPPTKDAKKRNDQCAQSPNGNERQNKNTRRDHVIDVFDVDDATQRSPDQKAKQENTSASPSIKGLDTTANAENKCVHTGLPTAAEIKQAPGINQSNTITTPSYSPQPECWPGKSTKNDTIMVRQPAAPTQIKNPQPRKDTAPTTMRSQTTLPITVDKTINSNYDRQLSENVHNKAVQPNSDFTLTNFPNVHYNLPTINPSTEKACCNNSVNQSSRTSSGCISSSSSVLQQNLSSTPASVEKNRSDNRTLQGSCAPRHSAAAAIVSSHAGKGHPVQVPNVHLCVTPSVANSTVEGNQKKRNKDCNSPRGSPSSQKSFEVEIGKDDASELRVSSRSSSGSEELSTYQALVAPRKFFSSLKKKVGNFFFGKKSPTKDIEAGPSASSVSTAISMETGNEGAKMNSSKNKEKSEIFEQNSIDVRPRYPNREAMKAFHCNREEQRETSRDKAEKPSCAVSVSVPGDDQRCVQAQKATESNKTNVYSFPHPIPPSYPNPGAVPKRPTHYRIPEEKSRGLVNPSANAASDCKNGPSPSIHYQDTSKANAQSFSAKSTTGNIATRSGVTTANVTSPGQAVRQAPGASQKVQTNVLSQQRTASSSSTTISTASMEKKAMPSRLPVPKSAPVSQSKPLSQPATLSAVKSVVKQAPVAQWNANQTFTQRISTTQPRCTPQAIQRSQTSNSAHPYSANHAKTAASSNSVIDQNINASKPTQQQAMSHVPAAQSKPGNPPKSNTPTQGRATQHQAIQQNARTITSQQPMSYKAQPKSVDSAQKSNVQPIQGRSVQYQTTQQNANKIIPQQTLPQKAADQPKSGNPPKSNTPTQVRATSHQATQQYAKKIIPQRPMSQKSASQPKPGNTAQQSNGQPIQGKVTQQQVKEQNSSKIISQQAKSLNVPQKSITQPMQGKSVQHPGPTAHCPTAVSSKSIPLTQAKNTSHTTAISNTRTLPTAPNSRPVPTEQSRNPAFNKEGQKQPARVVPPTIWQGPKSANCSPRQIKSSPTNRALNGLETDQQNTAPSKLSANEARRESKCATQISKDCVPKDSFKGAPKDVKTGKQDNGKTQSKETTNDAEKCPLASQSFTRRICETSADSSNKDTQLKTSTSDRGTPKSRRRLVYQENEDCNKMDYIPTKCLLSTSSQFKTQGYEAVKPEDVEIAIAIAMDKPLPSKTKPLEVATKTHENLIQKNDERDSPPETNEIANTANIKKRSKNKGKYRGSHANFRKSINCCCEDHCTSCTPAEDWDNVMAVHNRRKR